MSKLNLSEITSISDIQQLVINKFDSWKLYGEVSTTKSDDGSMILFNYTKKAQYSNRWNFFETVSRGLILNCESGEIVARSFDKFFNYFENGRKPKGHIVSVTEKSDGSCGILYRQKGGYKIATRGSFNSEQALWATKFLNENYNLWALPNGYTLIFEIIYPENRVVVDYGDREDLVLIGARNRFTGEYLPYFPYEDVSGCYSLYQIANRFGFTTSEVYTFNNVTQILEEMGKLSADNEGYVVEFSDGSRFKFKGDRYLELHKLISGLSFKNTVKAMESGTVDYIMSQIPEEFLEEFKGWIAKINQTIESITKTTTELYNDENCPKASKKEFAMWVEKYHSDLATYLFALYSGHDILPMIYKREFNN